MLDLKGRIPSFLYILDFTLRDVHAVDFLTPELGAINVIDRGYLDFTRLYALHLTVAFFVTPAKSNLKSSRVCSIPIDRRTGTVCDP